MSRTLGGLLLLLLLPLYQRENICVWGVQAEVMLLDENWGNKRNKRNNVYSVFHRAYKSRCL